MHVPYFITLACLPYYLIFGMLYMAVNLHDSSMSEECLDKKAPAAWSAEVINKRAHQGRANETPRTSVGLIDILLLMNAWMFKIDGWESVLILLP